MTQPLLSHMLNFLFPTSCLICKNLIESENLLCDLCLGKQPFLLSQNLIRGKLELPVFSLFNYEKPFSSIITSKFLRDKNLLGRAAGQFVNFLPKDFFKNSILVPIPIHWSRYFVRGFNQAELISNKISVLRNEPSLNILTRRKKTLFQADLTAAERVQNLKNAFAVQEKYKNNIRGNSFILVDDLCTTGSTLLSSAMILQSLGASSIKAISICKA